jgi:hypothetical protein
MTETKNSNIEGYIEIKHSKLEGYKALSVVGAELVGEFEKSKEGNCYKYAPLQEFTGTIRSAFSKHGLLMMQPIVLFEGKQYIKTLIYHVSCEEPICESMVPVDPYASTVNHLQNGQKIGAGITYARKYAIQAILCLSTDEASLDLDDISMVQEVSQNATNSKSRKTVPTKKETATPSKEEEEAKKKDPRYIAAMSAIRETFRDKELGYSYICNESKARKITPNQINILSISELEDIVSRIPTKHEEV